MSLAENWKHNSKIIFKCVNSAVRPSFKVIFIPVNSARDPLKTKTLSLAENWKHNSKIIFKCVNSAVRPNFKVIFISVNNARDPLKTKMLSLGNAKRASQTQPNSPQMLKWKYYTFGLFKIYLFCWNWKLFAKSNIDKCKS